MEHTENFQAQQRYEEQIENLLSRLSAPTKQHAYLTPGQMIADREDVAQYCASEIKRTARAYAAVATPPHVTPRDVDDETPLNAMEIHRAAVGLQLEIIFRNEASKDEGAVYCPGEDSPAGMATAYLSRGLEKGKQRRQMVHETAHHLQRTKVAPDMYGAEVVTCEGLSGAKIRHQIAKRVEQILAKRQ